jgi:hypothetical protein
MDILVVKAEIHARSRELFFYPQYVRPCLNGRFTTCKFKRTA